MDIICLQIDTATRSPRFFANGVECMRIDGATGYVAIGKTVPEGPLDTQGNNPSIFTRIINTSMNTPQSAHQIGLGGTGPYAAGSGPSYLFFAPNAAGTKSYMGRLTLIWENPAAGSETASIAFNVRANSADVNAWTERMRLTSGGFLGIGCTPSFILDVFGASYPNFTRTLTGTINTPQAAISTGLGGTATYQAGSGPSFLFFANNSAGEKEFMGRLGAVWENVANGAEAAGVAICVRANAADTYATTEAMRITADRRVGIQLTNPTAWLHLPAGTAAAGSAPMKFEPGTVNTVPESGTMEYDGTNFYLTPAAARKTIALTDDLHSAVTLAASADVLLGLTGQALSLDTQAVNTVLAGPAAGEAAAPTFRALAEADIPSLAAYALLAGRGGGQTLYGGAGAGDNLALRSTSHATKGVVSIEEQLYVTANSMGFGVAAPEFAAHFRASSSDLILALDSIGDTVATQLLGRRARGTIDAKTAVLDGTTLLSLRGYGYGETEYSATSRAYISLLAAETWTNSAQGTDIKFATTPTGTTTTQVRAVLTHDGRMSLGTSADPASSALLDLVSTLGALLVPRLTTTQRNALTAVNGMVIYNSTTNAWNFYENDAWVTK